MSAPTGPIPSNSQAGKPAQVTAVLVVDSIRALSSSDIIGQLEKARRGCPSRSRATRPRMLDRPWREAHARCPRRLLRMPPIGPLPGHVDADQLCAIFPTLSKASRTVRHVGITASSPMASTGRSTARLPARTHVMCCRLADSANSDSIDNPEVPTKSTAVMSTMMREEEPPSVRCARASAKEGAASTSMSPEIRPTVASASGANSTATRSPRSSVPCVRCPVGRAVRGVTWNDVRDGFMTLRSRAICECPCAAGGKERSGTKAAVGVHTIFAHRALLRPSDNLRLCSQPRAINITSTPDGHQPIANADRT